MKKALLILAAASLAAPAMNAQDDAGARFGIKLAPNMAWLKSDTKGLGNDGSKIGFTFGLVTEFPIGSAGNYRFSTGLFLNNVGGKYKQTYAYTENNQNLTKDLASDVKLQYIQVPLTMKLMTNEIGYMRYYGQIGFDAAYNIRAKADFDVPAANTNGTTTFTKLEDEDIKDNIQPFRAGLIIGAGMEYNFSGSTTLQVGLNYNNGFTNLLKDTKVGDKKAKIVQNYLELNLAVFF
jgi:opacity protein-like surface antigen